MKKQIAILTLLGATVATACHSSGNIDGEWYGLKDRALVTATFQPGQKLTVESEAMSSLTFSCDYTVNRDATPWTIDLTNATNGMAGAGIMRMGSDGTLDMTVRFGAPGMVERPKTFEADARDMTLIRLTLSRDKAKALAPVAVTEQIPPSEQLAFERNRRLGAGINLNAVADGNQHTPDAIKDAPLSADSIRSIAAVGFRSVRFDVSWARHCLAEPPYTIEPEFFKKIDGIVDECIRCGLAVSIDQHYYPLINMEGEATPEEYAATFDKLRSLWEQIAEHYKGYPDDMLYFDLLNEPNLTLGAEKWNETVATLIGTIRKTNPGRTILVCTPNLGQSWTLGYVELPKDEWNVIVEFHYYMPHLFTHQGLAYAMAAQSQNVSWEGTAEQKAQIDKDLDFCARWSKAHGRPLNMGEYGAINAADQASRARYIGYVVNAARSRGFSSHLWGFREPFTIRTTPGGTWEEPILKAMKLK